MADTLSANSWVSCASTPQTRLRLFCFPYAGGGGSIFRGWQDHLGAAVQVCPVQLPGRERRIAEKAFTDANLLVSAAARALRPYLDLPFALFGHSMGALICFELARYLRKEQNIQPACLFVSSRRAPQLPSRRPPIYALPDTELIEELRHLNGTPAEVLEHQELLELMLPILRADFKVVETYHYEDQPKLNCPIIAFGGLEDEDSSRAELEAWREQTASRFSLHMIPGDHFFIHTSSRLLLKLLALEIAKIN